MIDLAPERIRQACGATLLAGEPGSSAEDDVPARAVVDSREVRPGDLFVGIRGERTDGGNFAEQAIAAGAWGALVSPEHGLRAAGAAGRARVLGVEDPLAALGRLARVGVDRLWAQGCKVVGITGSTGKTSTRDILHALVSPPFEGRVHASRENYNTEVGLPLAVLEADAGTRVLVLEMATRGPGQIRELCEVAPPDVGVITNIGPVHLELLGTIEAVAEAKAELIAALPGGGVCVVPAAAEAIRPHLRQDVRTLTFANWPRSDDGALEDLERVAGAAADIRVLEAKAVRTSGGAPGLRAEIAILAERSLFVFNFGQAHNLVNALAAIGAARALGVPVPEMAQGARQVAFSSMRGEEIELSDGALIINDTYNANPISMRAALDHLATVAEQRRNARSVAVLGEMAELGAEAARFHREVGEHAARRGVALVLAVGALAEAYVEGYGDAGEVQRASDATEAAAILREAIDRNDVVLIKGSRAVGLERVTDSLVRRDAEGGP